MEKVISVLKALFKVVFLTSDHFHCIIAPKIITKSTQLYYQKYFFEVLIDFYLKNNQ